MSEINRRLQKVEKELRQVISSYLVSKGAGQSKGLLCISDVRVSPDLRQAKVYVSQIGQPSVPEDVLEDLRQNAPEVQSHIHSRLRMRYCPKLIFFNDDTVATSIKLDKIFDSLHATN